MPTLSGVQGWWIPTFCPMIIVQMLLNVVKTALFLQPICEKSMKFFSETHWFLQARKICRTVLARSGRPTCSSSYPANTAPGLSSRTESRCQYKVRCYQLNSITDLAEILQLSRLHKYQSQSISFFPHHKYVFFRLIFLELYTSALKLTKFYDGV